MSHTVVLIDRGVVGNRADTLDREVTMSVPETATTPWSLVNKIGLALAIVLGLSNIPSVLVPTPDGEVGPPFEILLADTVLGVLVVIAAVMAWRTGSRRLARLTTLGLVLILLTSLPALFVDVPAWVKASVGLYTLASVATCALMLAPNREPSAAGTKPRSVGA